MVSLFLICTKKHCCLKVSSGVYRMKNTPSDTDKGLDKAIDGDGKEF